MSTLEWLGGRRERAVPLRGRTCRLRVVSAREALEARREAGELAGTGADRGLAANGALVARALYRDGGRLFRDGAEVLEQLSPGEIAELARGLAELDRRENPSPEGPWEETEARKRELAEEPYERLKWRVLRAFSALPTEGRAREMTHGDYLYCALHLLLDQEEALARLCPQCRQEAEAGCCPVCGRRTEDGGGGENAAFDWARYEALKRGMDG